MFFAEWRAGGGRGGDAVNFFFFSAVIKREKSISGNVLELKRHSWEHTS